MMKKASHRSNRPGTEPADGPGGQPRRPRILLFGSQITTGGAQRVLLDQAGWFYDRGYPVQAVFYYDKDGLADDWRARYPFPISVLSAYRQRDLLRNALGLLKAMSRLGQLIRSFRPDVLESFTHDANLLGMIAAGAAGVPVRIATHHGQFARLGRAVKALHCWVVNSRLTTACVCVSERARAQALAEGIRAEKITVIANGVRPVERDSLARERTRAALGVGPGETLILTVGRLVPEKAQEALIDAVGLLGDGGSDVKAMIAGEGPCRAALRERIAAQGLTDRCVLLGNRNDVGALLNAADIFVLSSRTEGMPLALMEAMSLGLPAIGSDLEGIRALVGSGGGRLVPSGDAAELSRALTALLADPGAAAEMGRRGADRIRNEFSLDASLRKYAALFTAYLK